MHRGLSRGAIVLALLTATAGLRAATIDLSSLGCYGKASTPVTAASVGKSDSQVIKISPGTGYINEPCHHFIVEFSIPHDAGSNVPNTNHRFSFDSISNEPIDTEEKCESYSQTTLVIKKLSGSTKWKLAGYSAFTGKWSNGKCSFSTQQDDFRKKTFHASSSGTDKFRVASRVLTGPSGSPSPRTVCVGLRFANIEGVPQRSCADPSR
jgi:hypothetical protein